jgi:hypothetical protein
VKQSVNKIHVDNVTLDLALQTAKSLDANSTDAHLGIIIEIFLFLNTNFNGSPIKYRIVCCCLKIGCPVNQKWCTYTPAIRAEQLIFGFMFIAIGYAFTGI